MGAVMKAIPKTDDLHPDGVRIVISWDKMQVGASVFVPCINTEEAKKQIAKIAKKKGWKVQNHIRIEDEKFGVRIWRVL
jgi:K+-transporting ATPase c subunit